MNSKFKITISSDIEYNELCAEIYFEDQFVAIVTQEEGLENLKIELHPLLGKKFWLFDFGEFKAALTCAEEALWKMRKIS